MDAKIKSLVFLLAILLAPSVFAISVETELTKAVGRKLDTLNLGPHDISVEDSRKNIIISGRVNSQHDKIVVEEAVRSVENVSSVQNNLIVDERVADSGQATETVLEVRRAIEKRMQLQSGSVINVASYGDGIELSGRVTSPAELELLDQVVSSIPGAKVVRNSVHVVMKQPPTDAEIKRSVMAALDKNPEVDLRGLQVSVDSGIVHVSGAVPNHRVIDRILGIALMVDGVRDVKSNVQIGSSRG